MRWLEDLTDAELAKANTSLPSGLVNHGNTCYMNSAVQVLRGIPELQTALASYSRTSDPSVQPSALGLTAGLKGLYRDMSGTTESYSPFAFWTALRTHVPQFQETRNGMPAQQDAEECWGSIVTTLKATLPGATPDSRWVDQYMTGTMSTESALLLKAFDVSDLTCRTKSVEAPDEPPVTVSEPFVELKCNISADTNFLSTGIKDVRSSATARFFQS